MSCGDVYNTTINVNGRNVFSSRFSPCCCSMFPPPMISCFGFGFGGFGCGGFWPGSFEAGLGAGVGFAAGAALAPALPAVFKGIGKGICWVGKTIGKGISSLFHKKSNAKPAATNE